MNRTLPLIAEPVSIITAVYVEAHYGPDSITAAHAQQALQAWE